MSRVRRVRFPAAAFAAVLAVMIGAAPASAGGIFSGLLDVPASQLGAEELAAFAAGGPLVLSGTESQGGGTALNDVAVAPDGTVSIVSSSNASATVAGSPVTLATGGNVITGGFGSVTMENGSGLAGAQLASGFNNIQQNTVSFAFVLSGVPQL